MRSWSSRQKPIRVMSQADRLREVAETAVRYRAAHSGFSDAEVLAHLDLRYLPASGQENWLAERIGAAEALASAARDTAHA